MTSILQELYNENLLNVEEYIVNGSQYETIMGSYAYGVSNDLSDIDIYGFTIPPKEVIFPHLVGHIEGFGQKPKSFSQYQQHHIKYLDKEYDLNIFNIVKYFSLCMDNNPNMIDSLYTNNDCVIYLSNIGKHVRDNRDLFLHRGSYYRFMGYAHSQLHKLSSNRTNSKRRESILEHGYDIKNAYHLVRLVNECEFILTHGTLDLELDTKLLISIRNGEVELSYIENLFREKEVELLQLYKKSKLQKEPDEKKIKQLLLDCLEEQYGSLEGIVYVK